MTKDTPYDWSLVQQKLASDLPGLTETDFCFVKDCAYEMVDHLMRSSGTTHDEVMTALEKAGVQIPDPALVGQSSEKPSGNVIFAGEGASIQQF